MNEDIRVCKECGGKYDHIERLELYPNLPSSLELCPYCIEENYEQCPCCDYYVEPDSMIAIGYLSVCPKCYKEKSFICKSCGELDIRDNLVGRPDLDDLCGTCANAILYKEHIQYLVSDFKKVLITSLYQLQRTKTVPMMSKLKRRESFRVYQNENVFDALLIDTILEALVIIHDSNNKPFFPSEGCNTISGLKRDVFMELWRICDKRESEELKWFDGRPFHMWKHPYRIEAVTKRETFYGGEDGNLYGDTTTFYIIGTIPFSRNENPEIYQPYKP